ncbi:hypothetical protein [Streptomyces sp. NPDC049915]|uniref:hypothetical protein n=1 Tax=Streptomyces sp. NPDC049915 TaxID=3155510 RepID=UPI0034176EAC
MAPCRRPSGPRRSRPAPPHGRAGSGVLGVRRVRRRPGPLPAANLRCPDDRLADYYDRLGARPHRWYRPLLLLPTAGLQPRVFRRSCSGTPRDWVTLFQAVTDSPAGDSPLAFAREVLRWPMRSNPANTNVYHEVLAKGGCLPGAVTQVYALHSRTSSGPAIMACFLKDLPSAQWKILSGTPRQDRYMVSTMNRTGA